jgi:hypothetical protein
MGEVNFYLKKPNAKGLSLIYLKYKYDSQQPFVYSTGQTIDPNKWNDKKHRVKANNKVFFINPNAPEESVPQDSKQLLNDLLDNLQRTCKNAYNKEISKGIPHRSVLKKYLDDFMNQNLHKEKNVQRLFELFDKFSKGEAGRSKNPGTWRVFQAVLDHLKKFQSQKKYRVDFDTIDMAFYNTFTKYLQDDLHLKPSTIRKDIVMLKVVMNEAVELGYTDNTAFKSKKFNFSAGETDAVYLSDEELLKLFKYDLSDNERLEKVKDQFLFGCSTRSSETINNGIFFSPIIAPSKCTNSLVR